jgi:hypothetical protein
LQPRYDCFQRLLAIEEGRTAGDIAPDLPRNSVMFAFHYGNARNVGAVVSLTKLGQHNRLKFNARFLPFCHLEGHNKALPLHPSVGALNTGVASWLSKLQAIALRSKGAIAAPGTEQNSKLGILISYSRKQHGTARPMNRNELSRLERRKEQRAAARPPRVCPGCGQTYTPRRVDAVACSNKCRQRLFRTRR